jgi:hypothetical protein
MRKCCFLLLSNVLLCVTGARSQQPDMSQLLKNMQSAADAAKKTAPGKGNNKSGGLPADYDNSWKVTITMTRTMTEVSDMAETSGKCKEVKKANVSFSVHSSLSSDQTIGTLNGDDFEIFTAVDNNLKKYTHPLKGSYTASSVASGIEQDCTSGSAMDYSGSIGVDPSSVDFSFHFNKKTKHGDLMIALPEKYEISASGKATAWSNGSKKVSQDASELGKARMQLLFAVCGAFQGWNYPVFKDATTEAAVSKSPINGEMTSIGETKYGYEINYSGTKTFKGDIPDGYAGTDKTTYTTSVHISITNQDPIKYDAILELVDITGKPINYAEWVPQGPPVGNQDPRQASDHGNSLGVRVYIVDKKKPDQPLSSEDYDVDIKLPIISHEPGYCNNYPLNSTDSKPDLRFDKTLSRKENIIAGDQEVKTSDFSGHNFIAFFTSYDYGTFAKMTITVKLKYGDEVAAHFKGDKNTTIRIPKDENDNQVADAWEKKNHIFENNYSPFWDSEKQKLNGVVVNTHDGDGLALYEEYRGVVSKGVYTQLDPTKKELFVLNEIGNKAESGMDLFAKASGIKVVELTDKEIDRYDLVVNMNSDFARGGKQHALRLMEVADSDPGNLGITPNHERTDKPPTSPGDCTDVGINSNAVFKGNEYAVTIAHEMAHGCGVWHHGGLNLVDPPKPDSIDDSYILYAQDGTVISGATRDAVVKQGILPPIAGPGGQSSGDMHCLMSYYDQYVWARPAAGGGKVFINVDHADECVQNLFCNSKAGTFLNASTHKPYPVYGNASRGDCIHQFQVKDW